MPEHPLDRVIVRLTGIYHADGGVRGELAYLIGKLRGTAHCALCDITHSPVRRKREWDAWVATLPVPFDLVHLNERSAAVAAASGGQTPSVLAHVTGASGGEDLVQVLGPGELDGLDGSVHRFAEELLGALTRHDLMLPGPPLAAHSPE